MSEICECAECVAARKWIAEKTGIGGGPRPLSFLIASHEHMAAREIAEERGRLRGVEDLRTMLQNAAPHIIAAGHFRLWACKCGYCAPLQAALAPRDSAPREVPGPFAKGEDPAKCMHAWECHVYERGKDYCPYCFSMREEVPRDSGKEP